MTKISPEFKSIREATEAFNEALKRLESLRGHVERLAKAMNTLESDMAKVRDKIGIEEFCEAVGRPAPGVGYSDGDDDPDGFDEFARVPGAIAHNGVSGFDPRLMGIMK